MATPMTDVLDVRCLQEGDLWCMSAHVLDDPPTIVFAVGDSWPDAIFKFRTALENFINWADRNHEEFPANAAKIVDLRGRQLNITRSPA